MDTKLTMMDALKSVSFHLDQIEVKGTANLKRVLICKELINACLDAMSKPKEEPQIEVTDFKQMTDEEVKAAGLEVGK